MNKKWTVNLLLIIAVIALVVLPLAFAPKGAEFSGSDDQGSAAIAQFVPNFKPWVHPLWVPPSDEIESLLFAVQASLGTGFIAFFFGYKMGSQKPQTKSNTKSLSTANQV